MKRSWRWLPISPDQLEPLWEITPMPPSSAGIGGAWPHTLRRSTKFMKPIELLPHTAMPASRAIAPRRSVRRAWPGADGS